MLCEECLEGNHEQCIRNDSEVEYPVCDCRYCMRDKD